MGKSKKKQKTDPPVSKMLKEDDDDNDLALLESSDVAKIPPPVRQGDDGESSSSDDDDDDDDDDDEEELNLEGVLVRNPDVPSSDDDDDDDDDDDNDDNNKKEKDNSNTKKPNGSDNKKRKSVDTNKQSSKPSNNGIVSFDDSSTKKQKKARNENKKSNNNTNNNKNSNDNDEPETVQVDFIFCDMHEKFFHGLKMQLYSSLSSVYNNVQSSALSDLMIENLSVGTVISTESDDPDDQNVYGFASVLNVVLDKHHKKLHPPIEYLKKLCLDHCPAQHKKELEIVLSGKTARPAGFLLHGRMVNLPLEIVEILHQQLVLDMDWAVDNAECSERERKALDFGAFVRIAPCYRPTNGGGTQPIYKFFDDETFASNAEFVYTFDAPTGAVGATGSSSSSINNNNDSSGERQLCSVIVMTKTGHRAALKDLNELVHGSAAK